jgi:phage terminase small subunit
MSKPGPKVKNAKNASSSLKGVIRHSRLEPTSELSEAALVEFRRLVCVLLDRGTLERVDLAVLTECARITDLLNRSHKLHDVMIDPKAIGIVAGLTAQRRGLLRELGLTLQPSRSVVHTNARDSQNKDPIEAYIKLA